MKVLKDNYKKANAKEEVNLYPRKMICEQCRSELEYEKDDLRMGALGCIYLNCPLCGYENMLEEHEDTIILTKDNVEYPIHFFHTSTETGAVDCCTNERVKESINRAIDFFRKNKDEFVWYTATGNLHMSVWRCDGDAEYYVAEYYVVVTNNYHSTYIPFENEDYIR